MRGVLSIIALIVSILMLTYIVFGIKYPKERTLREFADSVYTSGYYAGKTDMELSMLRELYTNRDTVKRVIYMRDIDYKRIDRRVDSMKAIRDSIHNSKY